MQDSSTDSQTTGSSIGSGLASASVYEIDHLVLGCADLQQGLAMLESRLGAALPLGGKHAQMGTHNALMRLGERQYFELIAINPDAPAPPHARWFGLDDPVLRARLQDELLPLNWVLRCPDLREALDSLPLTGQAQQGGYMACRLWRDDLQWDMALAPSGQPALRGALPSLIRWTEGQEPWLKMTDLGWRIGKLRLPSALAALQQSLGIEAIEAHSSDGHNEGSDWGFCLEKDGQQLCFERHDRLN